MELYPAFDARERLLDGLARLGKSVGWDAFVANPILTPEPQWFPDAWSPDRRGVRLLSTRLLRYVGLEHHVRVTVEPPPEDHVAAWFSGIEGDECLFGIDPRQLEREDSFVAALCHEACHAYRRHHIIELTNRDREEEATDLTAVFLGFGVFLLNAADQFETSGQLVGTMVYTKVHSARLGYLSPVALAFLLAVQATVRDASKKFLKEIAGHLPANQRAAFEKSLDELRGQRSFLLDRLAIPDPKTWPALRTTPVLVDLGIDEEDESPLSEEYAEKDDDGDDRYVFRMVADASGRYRLLGLAIGSVLGGFLGLKARLASTGAILMLAVLGGALGWFLLQHVGRKRREDTCANCERPLPVESDRCTTCRAHVVACVRSTEEKFELEEKIEDDGFDRALREWDARR